MLQAHRTTRLLPDREVLCISMQIAVVRKCVSNVTYVCKCPFLHMQYVNDAVAYIVGRIAEHIVNE